MGLFVPYYARFAAGEHEESSCIPFFIQKLEEKGKRHFHCAIAVVTFCLAKTGKTRSLAAAT